MWSAETDYKLLNFKNNWTEIKYKVLITRLFSPSVVFSLISDGTSQTMMEITVIKQ